MIKKFFLPLFTALALTGCSDDVPAPGNEEDPGISGGSFLAVNIVTQGSGSSRAGENNGTTTGPTFEDGVGNENTVNAVRLYFFTATGDPITIKKGATTNYYDIPVDSLSFSTPANHNGTTVEKVINSVVIVEKGERLPAKVVAIINPITSGNDALAQGSMSLSDLQNRCLDYASYANSAQSFVMTNSVYADVNGLVDATNISAANYAPTHEAAKENPVEIYVERTVAKVRLDVTGLGNSKITAPDGKTTLYLLKRAIKNDNGEITGEEDLKIAEKETTSAVPDGTQSNAYTMKPVYLRLDGWDVTADVSHAWFFKHVNMTWQGNKLGSDVVWNDPANHRSYWADYCNPQGVNSNQYYAYKDANHFKCKLFDGKESVYCNENAERPGDAKLVNTKVLIKGTLCNEAGEPLMISEYGGNRFIDDASLLGLKNRYIEMLKGMRSELPWVGYMDNGTQKYRQLDESDLDMIPVEYINPSDLAAAQSRAEENNSSNTYKYASGRYYVYPCLNKGAAGKTWYKTVRYADGTHTKFNVGPEEPVSEINKYLLKLSHAMVWNDGKTYYYIDIKHLGDNANGNWGTVRNHLYDIDINKIYGIGTPVYGDELVIEPEKPENDETFIAARINILQWRVVPQTVNLDWN